MTGWPVTGWTVIGWPVAGWPVIGWPVIGWTVIGWTVAEISGSMRHPLPGRRMQAFAERGPCSGRSRATRVFYSRTSDLVQKLQVARRDLVVEAALAKLDRFDLIILDDITYAHKDQAETGVIFKLIARRCEFRSIAIAANQPFSGWDQIFPDKAMTVAAIDRVRQWARTRGTSRAHSTTRQSWK